MKQFLLLFLILVMTSSCDKNQIYSKFDKVFEENRWSKSDLKTYDFKVDATGNYSLFLEFSHVADYQFGIVPVKVQITNPDQTISTENVLVQVKDLQGNDAGACSGDYCDLETPVFEHKKLMPGKYKIVVGNTFERPYLPNVLGVGIKVIKN